MKAIAITGGKGGVGKTCLAAAIGSALAKAGQRTLLFDADLAMANLDIILGIQAPFTLQHVVADEKQLGEILCEGPYGLKVAVGASAVGALMTAGPKRLEKFFHQISALEDSFDYILFDTGAGVDRRVMTFLQASEDVVVVVTPDPASLVDGYATIKLLLRKNPNIPVRVVVNRVQGEFEAAQVFKALSTIVKNFLKTEVTFLGFVPDDSAVSSCIRGRKSFIVEEPGSPASQSVFGIASKIQSLESSWTGSMASRTTLLLMGEPPAVREAAV